MDQLTPGGVAGVAVVRVPACERMVVLALLRAPGGGPFVLRPQVPQRALLRLDERDLDDVLVVDRGPRGLELHLHGAPAVLAALHRRFALAPAAPRSPAEQLLREALCDEQLDLALEQLEIGFDHACAQVAQLPPSARRAARDAALARSHVAMALAIPHRVVLIGRQNAGKSSLFNRLLGRERVLTGPEPGLTRDPVVDRTTLAGYPYELADTAGEGPTGLALDAAAVQRGRDHRRGALVVLVVDAAAGATDEDRRLLPHCDLVVANKIDLPCAAWPADVPRDAAVSAHQGRLAGLRAAFGDLLRRHRGLPPAGPVGGFAALTPSQLAVLRTLRG